MTEKTSATNIRTYGHAPFRVAVLHGGPGAPGEMAPVARELSHTCGILEPLQTATSLEGQVLELAAVLEENGTLPMTLIGSSWGAMLGFILAAKRPSLVSKLILVGSAPYEERFAANIMATRLGRLSESEGREVHALLEALNDPSLRDKSAPFAQLGRLLSKADSYDPLTTDSEVITPRPDIYQSVWREAQHLRATGELLELGRHVVCPVVAIHGDYDPHPAEGVEQPLTRTLRDFRFVLLKNCGHHPWIERSARDKFYDILTAESCS